MRRIKRRGIDLGEIRKQDNPSASDIQAKVDAVTAAQGKIMALGIQHGIDVRNVLTAEQKEKLGEMRRGGRMGFRGHGGTWIQRWRWPPI